MLFKDGELVDPSIDPARLIQERNMSSACLFRGLFVRKK